jgi:hypothetical protein
MFAHWMDSNGLKSADLAKKLKVSTNHIYRWRSDKVPKKYHPRLKKMGWNPPDPNDPFDLGVVPNRAVSKLHVKNVATLFQLTGTHMDPRQVVRELVVNSLEADATRVRVGPDWNHVEACVANKVTPTYRLMVEDDGHGMDCDELRARVQNLMDPGGSKKVGIQDNFNIGARMAGLLVSPKGVIIMSWRDGIGAMVRLFQTSGGDYALFPFETGDGGTEEVVVAPDEYKPDFVNDHGTVVILVGTSTTQDTALELLDDRYGVHGLQVWLQDRFTRLPSKAKVQVYEFNGTDKSKWATSKATAVRAEKGQKGSYREMHGCFYFHEDQAEIYEQVKVSVKDDDGTSWGATIHLFVRHPSDTAGKLPKHVRFKDAHSIVTENYTFGFVYKNEVFGRRRKNHTHSYFSRLALWTGNHELMRRLSVYVEPHQNTGVHNDPARSRLLYRDGKSTPPLDAWGEELKNNMPKAIEALLAPSLAANVDDFVQEVVDSYYQEHYKPILRTRRRGVRRTPKEAASKTSKTKGATGPRKAKSAPKTKWQAMDTATEGCGLYDPSRNILYLNRTFPEFELAIKRAKTRNRRFRASSVEDAALKGIAISMACALGQTLCRRRSSWWSQDDHRESVSTRGLITMSPCGGFALDAAIDETLKTLTSSKRKRKK